MDQLAGITLPQLVNAIDAACRDQGNRDEHEDNEDFRVCGYWADFGDHETDEVVRCKINEDNKGEDLEAQTR